MIYLAILTGEDYENLTPASLHKARFRALNWTYQLRNENQPTHPRKFHVLDLVSELHKWVDAPNYTNPSAMSALCNAGERITERNVEKLTSVFWQAHREFWTDTQAFAVLALVCAAKQPREVFDMDEIDELTMELEKQQYRNGTVENLKTTALVLQEVLHNRV
ncbi:hypothetical protein AVEN_36646-1 [Araneus ventricosus]|uniref:Uncharacterized protein n=1 Tax=Araneus ventricosus TaxID=182803 RepID=A0A4Y2FXQ8_ARAVE|nr:hypothetical protein AVEN_36646-1 [Araneus ventricosus]